MQSDPTTTQAEDKNGMMKISDKVEVSGGDTKSNNTATIIGEVGPVLPKLGLPQLHFFIPYMSFAL